MAGAQITDAEAARMNIRRAGRIAFLRLPLVCGDRIVTPEALKPVGNQSFSQPPQAPAEDRETAATAFASKPADLHYWCARGQATAVWRQPRRIECAELFNPVREAARSGASHSGVLRGVLYARLRYHGCPAKMVPDFSWDAQGNFRFVPSCNTAL
jgi:hypothetical protein